MPSPQPAVLYARVSSDEQEKEGFSIPAQTKLLRGYAAREGFEIVDEYVDVETAKAPGRAGFNSMVAFFGKQSKTRDGSHRCRTVLVEKTDRLYRNLKDYVVLDDLDVDIHFVKEGVVLSPESHSSEKFMHGIKVLMAKNYIDNLSEEVRKGMREKAEQGIWPGKAPLGYRNVAGPDGKKHVEPDLEVAPLVVKMFEWYATGKYSLVAVAQKAVDAGLALNRTDNIAATVHATLRNRIYYGDFKWKDKIYKGIHTPLITHDLWSRCQKVMKDRGTRKPRRVKHDFPFSRLITCGHCGCAMVGELKKKRYVYYHCTGYKGKCPEKYVREEVLEGRFTEVIRRLRFDEEILEWVSQALREGHQEARRFHEESMQRLQREYARLQNRIDQMYIDKLDGRVSVTFFDQKSAEWREEQAEILRNIERHQHANQSYLQEGVAVLELASRAAEIFEQQTASEKRRLLDFVVSNCSWANGELTVQFRQPFDLIADGATAARKLKVAGVDSDDLHQEMYPREDSNL